MDVAKVWRSTCGLFRIADDPERAFLDNVVQSFLLIAPFAPASRGGVQVMTDTVRLGLFAIRQFHQAIPGGRGTTRCFDRFPVTFASRREKSMSAPVSVAEFFLSQTCGIEHEYGYVCPCESGSRRCRHSLRLPLFPALLQIRKAFQAFARIMSAAGLKVMLPRLRSHL